MNFLEFRTWLEGWEAATVFDDEEFNELLDKIEQLELHYEPSTDELVIRTVPAYPYEVTVSKEL